MIKRLSVIVIILIGLSFTTNTFLPLDNAYGYNKPWDQGHDSTNPGDPDDPEDPPEPPCEECQKVCYLHSPSVSCNDGNYIHKTQDLFIPGNIPLSITRAYNTRDNMRSGFFGYGWSSNFGMKLVYIAGDTENIAKVLMPNGQRYDFIDNGDGTFAPPLGIYQALTQNNDGTYILEEKNGNKYEFDAEGKLSRVIDRNNNEIGVSYDNGCPNALTDNTGVKANITKGPNGKIASIADFSGRTVSYGYDSNGNLTSVTNPNGNTTYYNYDSEHNLVSIIDPRGNTTVSASYYADGKVSRVRDKEGDFSYNFISPTQTRETDNSTGATWIFNYDSNGAITSIQNPLGYTTSKVFDANYNLISETDANGNTTTYTYDSYGNMLTKTDPLGNMTTYTYIPGTDWIETETDPDGVTAEYEYDSNGNLTKIIRDLGGALENTTSYSYDNEGNQTSVTDPLGHTTSYEYDVNGNMSKMTDPLGNVTVYTYDNRGNRLTETNALGSTTTYAYDVMDKLTSVTGALGNVTTYAYDANGNRTLITDANGNTHTFTYDAYNRLVQETDPLGNTTSYAYDSRDNRISMTDANSNTTTYTYDILNRMTRETNALGGHTDYTYDAVGNILAVTDANGNTTTFTYDANNRKISETNAAGETTNYTFDANGNQLTTLLPNANTITKTYDSLNRMIGVSDTLGQIRSYTYSLAGLLLTESDVLGNTTAYSYDAGNRLIQRTDPMGNNARYTYDAIGNLLSNIDRENNTTRYSYDTVGRKISTIDSLGNITSFSYDNIGKLLSITDANGNTTSYSYDSVNRLTQETYADGASRSFAYDSNGNLTTRTDQNGNITLCSYDVLNRRIKVDYPGSNDNTYTYNAVGNLLTANNQDATISMGYDNAYRLTQSSQSGRTVSYSYDIADNIRTITYPGGKVLREVRNARGLLTRVENPSSQSIVQYTYDNADRLLTKSYLNGVVANFTNNANGWVTDINYNNGGSQILEFQYGFDKEGNRVYANKSHDLSNAEQYTYDGKYRLTQFKRGNLDSSNNIPSPVTQTAYNLDALGNWVSKTTNGTTEARSHNVVNETTRINVASLTYDSNGNITDNNAETYEYDYENRLTRVTRKSDGLVLVEFKYDAMGRRVEKNDILNGTVTKYYLDRARVIEEQENGSTSVTYVYGNGIDEILQMQNVIGTYYYHTNSLGSIGALTGSSGDVEEYYRYGAYGDVSVYNSSWDYIGASSPIGNYYLFTGRRLDSETGLYYYRARYFSPDLGRFLQRDPLGYVDGMNLYEFVKSNPVNFVDPTGLWYTPAEVFLGIHYYRYLAAFGWLVPDHVDISRWNSVYRKDSAVIAQVKRAHEKIISKTKELANVLTKGESKVYINYSKNLVYITSIYSFGGGHLDADIDCTITGTGCGAKADCVLDFSTVDEYKDPVDLHQYYKFPMWFANVGGTPYTFGLSWNEAYNYTFTKSQ